MRLITDAFYEREMVGLFYQSISKRRNVAVQVARKLKSITYAVHLPESGCTTSINYKIKGTQESKMLTR